MCQSQVPSVTFACMLAVAHPTAEHGGRGKGGRGGEEGGEGGGEGGVRGGGGGGGLTV